MPLLTKPILKLDASHLFGALIIGAGPAGLSTALALCRMKRTTAVFSTNVFRNDTAHRAHTVLSRDHQPPSEIRRIGWEQVEAYGTTRFVERGVVKARRVEGGGTGFEVVDEAGEVWRGRTVVLAMGVRDLLPADIEGYAECWGSSIYQCLFCDGLERSERPAGMLGWRAMGGHMVDFLFLLGPPRVTIFGNGPLQLQDEAARRALEIAKARGAVVEERRIRRLVHLPNEEGIEVVFEDGESTRVGFLQHSPPTEVVGANLAKDLGVEVLADERDGTMLKTNAPFGETNVKGVFIAGDAGTVMKQVAMAMQQGGAVGAAIAIKLGQEEDEEVAARLWPEKSRKPEAAVRAPQQNGVDVDDRDRSDGGRWD